MFALEASDVEFFVNRLSLVTAHEHKYIAITGFEYTVFIIGRLDETFKLNITNLICTYEK